MSARAAVPAAECAAAADSRAFTRTIRTGQYPKGPGGLSPGATWHWGAEAAPSMGGSDSCSLSRRLGVAPAGTLPMAL